MPSLGDWAEPLTVGGSAEMLPKLRKCPGWAPWGEGHTGPGWAPAPDLQPHSAQERSARFSQESPAGVSLRIFWAMEESAGKAGLSGKSWMKSRPSSRLRVSSGSRGTEPGWGWRVGGEGQAGRPSPPPQPRSPRAALPRPRWTHSRAQPPQDAQQPPSRPCRLPGAPAEESTGRLWLAALTGRGVGGVGGSPLSPGGAGPCGSPSPLTQEGDAGMSRQLLAASLGEDVGALLGHRHGVHLHPLCSQGAGGVGGSWPPMPAIAQDSPSSGGRQSRSCSPRAQSPAAPPSCRRSAPASRPPRTPPGDRERGRGSRWVPRKQPRWVRRTGQSVCPGAKAPMWDQYLGRGDHEGPQGAVGAQGVHHGHVLIRGPRGRVHKQVVQLPPGHIGHKLLYQRCGDPGRLRVGGSRRAGRVSLGPRSPQGRVTFGPRPTCIRRAVCATVRQEQGETLPQHPQDFCSGPSFDGWSGDPPRADVCAPERWPVGNARQAWPGSSPHPGPAPTPGSPALALGGSRTLSAEAEAPEPAQVPHRAPSCPGRTRQLKASWLRLTLSLPRPTVCVLAGLTGQGWGERLGSEDRQQSFPQRPRWWGGWGASNLAWHYRSSWGLSTPQPRPAAPAGSPQT